MKPFILGAIFARGGSKGIPQKNIKPLNGKPLIAYAVKTGLAVSLIDDLIVSTDDKHIASVAKDFGARVPFLRPARLAQDHTPELLAWKHAIEMYEKLEGKKVDVLVSIPTTSPLRDPIDVKRAIETLLKMNADIVITVRESERSPYFNMVQLDKNKDAHLVITSRRSVSRRQDAPKVFDITTVAYAAKASYIMKTHAILKGKVKAVIVPQERALDIDTLYDFQVAEFLIKRKLRAR